MEPRGNNGNGKMGVSNLDQIPQNHNNPQKELIRKMNSSKNHPFLFKNSINFKLGWQTKEFLVGLEFQSYQGTQCQNSVAQNHQIAHGNLGRILSQKCHDIQRPPSIFSIHQMTYEHWFQMLLQLQLLQFGIIVTTFV